MISCDIKMYSVLYRTDPPMFDFVSSKGPNLDYAKVEFIAPIPPRITEDEAYAINEGSTSDYCRFSRGVMSFPPMNGIEYDFDLEVEFGSGPADGAHYQIILHADHAIWCYLMKKDLHPDFLR